MSHTKGKLMAEAPDSAGGWWVLRDESGGEVDSGDGGMYEANAKRIVQCWNSHDALVEALESCVSDWADGCYGTLKEQTFDEEKVKLALKSAKGE